jgi:hypothetical protein
VQGCVFELIANYFWLWLHMETARCIHFLSAYRKPQQWFCYDKLIYLAWRGFCSLFFLKNNSALNVRKFFDADLLTQFLFLSVFHGTSNFSPVLIWISHDIWLIYMNADGLQLDLSNFWVTKPKFFYILLHFTLTF